MAVAHVRVIVGWLTLQSPNRDAAQRPQAKGTPPETPHDKRTEAKGRAKKSTHTGVRPSEPVHTTKIARDRRSCSTSAMASPTHRRKMSKGERRATRTLAVALLSMDRMLRHTDVTVSAGLQPSYKTFKQTVGAQASNEARTRREGTTNQDRRSQQNGWSVGHSQDTPKESTRRVHMPPQDPRCK